MERKKTHLIYMDESGYVWMQEHGVGASHPINADFFCEVPDNEDKRWISGKPAIDNMQFLTLCPFYPSQRLDVSVEINSTPKIMRHVNHPAFEGCVKFMPIHLLELRPIPKHIERSIYDIGLCHYGHKEPYKIIEVKSDNEKDAIQKGRALLNPGLTESVVYVSVKSNEEYDLHYLKKPKFKK